MAHSDTIEDQLLLSLADQISQYQYLPVLVGASSFEMIELAESYSVWTLPEKNQVNVQRLEVKATKAGTWIHQIDAASYKTGERQSRLYACATSLERGTPPGFTLLSVEDAQPSGSRPALMRNAAKWIDANVSGDPLVRFLIVSPPSIKILLFWLKYETKDSVVVIQRPESRSEFQYNKEYGFDEAVVLL